HEADDPDALLAALQQLSNGQRTSVAGAVDDRAAAGPPLLVDELADQQERRPRQRDEADQQHGVNGKHRPRVADEPGRVQYQELRDRGPDEHALRDDNGVAQPEVPPYASVHANPEERDHLRRHHDGQAVPERAEVLHELLALEPEPVCGVVRDHDQREVEQHFRDAPLVHELDDERRDGPFAQQPGILSFVDPDAGEIDGDQHHYQHEDDADQHRPAQADIGHRDGDRAADRGQQPQDDDGLALGQADRNETMRRVI